MTAPFKIPQHWTRYRSFDYGLDMFACFWWAVDEDGRCWCYRSFEHEGLIVKDAAKAALDHTLANEQIIATYAPPDMWNRQKETGKTMAELFLLNGVNIVRSDNNRVQGHMVMKGALRELRRLVYENPVVFKAVVLVEALLSAPMAELDG